MLSFLLDRPSVFESAAPYLPQQLLGVLFLFLGNNQQAVEEPMQAAAPKQVPEDQAKEGAGMVRGTQTSGL